MKDNNESVNVSDIILAINYYHICIFCLKVPGDWHPFSTYLKGLPVGCGRKLCTLKNRITNCIEDICSLSLLYLKTKSAVL